MFNEGDLARSAVSVVYGFRSAMVIRMLRWRFQNGSCVYC